MYYITTPTGIDVPIQDLQASFYAGLWTTLTTSRKFYGRAHRNQRNADQLVPEVYVALNEYKEVLIDDTVAASIFFDPSGEVQNEGGQMRTEIGIVVSVNLKSAYPLLPHRATEEAIRDVLDIINASPFQASRVIQGVAAYEPFDATNSKINMQPWFTFRVVTEVTYVYQNC